MSRRAKTSHNIGCMCGGCVYKRIPRIMYSFQCRCHNPEWVGFGSRNLNLIGTFCNKCGKPHKFSLVIATFTCEGCGKLFTYDWRKFKDKPLGSLDHRANFKARIKFPLPNVLCEVCDVPNSTPRSRRRGFRIN